MLETLKSRGRKTVTTRLDLEPVNIIWSQGSVKDAENLLKKRSRQISLVASQATILETNDEIASILLDFGCEIHGGIRIQAWQGEPGESIKVRIRFVRIDVLEKGTLVLKSVLAQLVYKDVPYRGSFRCNDDLLNRIWMTGAYTMHLNMQEYLWDGIKRDRLVWIADMHPMIKTIMAVFGEDESVKNSLDFIRKETPLPGWMNKIAMDEKCGTY